MNAATSEPRKFSPSPRPTTSGELRRAADHAVGVLRVDGDQRERALEPAAHLLHRGGQVAGLLERALEQVGGDLGVGLGAQVVAVRARARRAASAKFSMMPLCTTRDAAVLAEVRVRVDVVGGAVGGPAGVPDAGRGGGQRVSPRAPSRGWRACRRACRRRSRRRATRAMPGGVVAAVLQPAQTLDHDVASLLLADVPHDPAHGRSVYGVAPDRPVAAAAGRPACSSAAHACRRRPRRGERELAVRRARPGRLGRARLASTEQPLTAEEIERRPRSRRRAGPRRGAAGLPAAVAAAEPVRRGRRRAAPRAPRSSCTSRSRRARRS